jgi:hypothetical protein
MATVEKFTALFGALIAAFPEAQILPNTVPVYSAALADIPDDDLARAVAEHIAHARKFPAIAELRELALAGRCPNEGEAWAEVRRAFTRFGRAGKPAFSHPLILAAVEAIGWRALCDSTQENEPLDRAHFLRVYRQLADRELFQRTSFTSLLARLPGPKDLHP